MHALHILTLAVLATFASALANPFKRQDTCFCESPSGCPGLCEQVDGLGAGTVSSLGVGTVLLLMSERGLRQGVEGRAVTSVRIVSSVIGPQGYSCQLCKMSSEAWVCGPSSAGTLFSSVLVPTYSASALALFHLRLGDKQWSRLPTSAAAVDSCSSYDVLSCDRPFCD
ncbi:hypothetical protein OE88DRAFT_1648662 [Heliocybe sulcata]|uniref:Hydrophobin n=1 Tax=Heliocybe sulcata TaxID=5364 RepID=A0A5C3MLR3_9AGAM|nr:hypothetical protein OE88DRAFT_1648662 [Heliocybe sulcata]